MGLGRYAGVLSLLSVALTASSGCAAFSGTVWSMGASPAPHENARTEAVPLPGFTEQLSVELHPVGLSARTTTGGYRRSASTTARTTTAPTMGLPGDQPAAPPRLACQVSQTGDNVVHIAASRYGKGWKLATATMFVVEAGLAALFLLTDGKDGESNVPRRFGGGLLAVDALVTAGLFFIPKRDVLETKQRQVTTLVRTDCPDGLVISVDGKEIEVDATGKLGPLGPELLDRAMIDHAKPIAIRYRTYSTSLAPSPQQRCEWVRARGLRQHTASVCQGAYGGGQRGPVGATLRVAPGTLSSERFPAPRGFERGSLPKATKIPTTSRSTSRVGYPVVSRRATGSLTSYERPRSIPPSSVSAMWSLLCGLPRELLLEGDRERRRPSSRRADSARLLAPVGDGRDDG